MGTGQQVSVYLNVVFQTPCGHTLSELSEILQDLKLLVLPLVQHKSFRVQAGLLG